MCLHRVTPWAMLGHGDEVVPIFANGTHIAVLAFDSLARAQWVARNNARLPLVSTFRAVQSSLINFRVTALATAHRQILAYISIHVNLKDPVTNFISFTFTQQVLLRQYNIIW